MKLFTVKQIRGMSDADVRKAYSNLRSVANKRIQRLNKAGLGTNPFTFPTIQQIQDTDKITMNAMLADVSNFLRSPRTTVKGEKNFLADFTARMDNLGYGGLVTSRGDVYQLLDYLDYLREHYSDKVYTSGDALDMLQNAQRLNMPIEMLKQNYEDFASHLDEMDKLRRSPGGREFSQARLDKLLKKWK